MKYKLINKTTGEEHICEKVVIDVWDYYVSDEEPKRKSICIAKTNAVYQNNQQSLNNKLVFLDKEVVNKHEIIGRVEFGEDAINLPFDVSELKKVIATNNPSIDIPKVVEEVERLAREFATKPINSLSPNGTITCSLSLNGFEQGYNKSQETHPFSMEDVIEFLNWIRDNTVFDSAPKPYHRKTQTRLSQEELLQLWKEQRTKILYYE